MNKECSPPDHLTPFSSVPPREGDPTMRERSEEARSQLIDRAAADNQMDWQPPAEDQDVTVGADDERA